MVINFNEFLRESLDTPNPKQLASAVVTALAVFHPEHFTFLSDIRNRYTFSDHAFSQLLRVESQREKRIVCPYLNQVSVNVEADWSRLKKCVVSAGQIRKTFDTIKRLTIENGELSVMTETDLNVIKNRQVAVRPDDLVVLLGFTDREVYAEAAWDTLVIRFINCLKGYLKPQYREYVNQFCPHTENASWKTYKKQKHSRLGIKITDLPKLYYNTLHDFALDIVYKEDAFTDYRSFCKAWMLMKKDCLNNQILVPKVHGTTHETEQMFKQIIRSSKGIEANTHYAFGKDGSLAQVPTTREFEDKFSTDHLLKTMLVNKKGDLIVHYSSGIHSIKVLVGTTGFCPSKIKIKGMYE